MEITQIIVLVTLFALSFLGYWFFNPRLANIPAWLRHNLMFTCFGIIGALIFTPFLYPYDFWKNLPVFTVIPFCAYNVLFLISRFTDGIRASTIVREIVGTPFLVLGAYIGVLSINTLHIGVFNENDLGTVLIIVLLFSMARLLFNYASLEKVISKSRKELKDTKIDGLRAKQRLEMLYAKINPHFLYNALNTIAGLAVVDGQKTKDMALSLSKLLRYSLNYSENDFATIEEEVEIVQAYLAVEKIRFGENLHCQMSIAHDAKRYRIPRFLLQPIVENCCKHAFKESQKEHFISIDISIVQRKILIILHDNGIPFPDKIIPGFGFKNVNDKLQLLLPGKHEFEITNKPKKQVKIVIAELYDETVK